MSLVSCGFSLGLVLTFVRCQFDFMIPMKKFKTSSLISEKRHLAVATEPICTSDVHKEAADSPQSFQTSQPASAGYEILIWFKLCWWVGILGVLELTTAIPSTKEAGHSPQTFQTSQLVLDTKIWINSKFVDRQAYWGFLSLLLLFLLPKRRDILLKAFKRASWYLYWMWKRHK